MGRRELGQWGESIAADYLRSQGYQIVERNWRCARGEIDILAKAGDEFIFVEVKTRRGRRMGTPEEGLTISKGKKLIDLAQRYLLDKDLDEDWRIDLVAVELDEEGDLIRCEHIPNAVLNW